MAGSGGHRDGPLDGGKITSQDVVPALGKTLQVDVHRVQQGEQGLPGARLDGAVGDQDVDHPGLMHQPGAVPHIFIAHQGLVVGVGHPDVPPAAQFQCGLCQLFRGAVPGEAFGARRGNFGVLAEGAAEIAPEAPRRQNQAAGVEPPQGLFLDGVQGQGGEAAIVQGDNLPAPIGPGPAQAGLALRQGAAVKAEITGNLHRCRTTSNRWRV